MCGLCSRGVLLERKKAFRLVPSIVRWCTNVGLLLLVIVAQRCFDQSQIPWVKTARVYPTKSALLCECLLLAFLVFCTNHHA